MNLYWIILLVLVTGTSAHRKCPRECTCNLDDIGRIQTICNQGGMSQIPAYDLDAETEVLIIRGPGNHLTIGPVFQSLNIIKLEIVRITDSNVPSIGSKSFWGLKKLRILDLSRNNITTLSKEQFKSQGKLDELDLSHNKIVGLTSWVFGYLEDLRRLSLSNNSIEKLAARDFLGLVKLKYLDLSDNPLTDLPPDVFRDIPDLRELRCRRCALKKIESSLFRHIPNLLELDVGENYLEHFCEDDFQHVKRLTKLHLDRNQLTIIVNNLFPTQKSLEYLDLSHNRITKITINAFGYLSNLTTLDLSYNKLVKLQPDTVRPLRHLKTLNISGNSQIDMYDIRHTFNNLRNLTALSVADMGPMPMDMLFSFDQLKVLNLSGNHLKNTLLTLIDPIGSLEKLDLSRNRLNGFDETQMEQLKTIQDVKLEENPLICDICHMGRLIAEARMLNWNIYPTCVLPENLYGKPISDLNISTLSPCIEYINDHYHMNGISENILRNTIEANMNVFAVICSIAFITVTIIILIIALSMRHHSAKYYTNEDKRSDGLYEKNFDSLSITGNEMNYKYPIDDIIYSIDEMALQQSKTGAPNQVPSLITSFGTRNGYFVYETNIF